MRSLLCVGQQANVVLRIRAQLRQADQIDAVLLDVHARGKVVAIALIIAVIEAAIEIRGGVAKLSLPASKYQNKNKGLCVIRLTHTHFANHVRSPEDAYMFEGRISTVMESNFIYFFGGSQ